jgi:hypothetical protein
MDTYVFFCRESNGVLAEVQFSDGLIDYFGLNCDEMSVLELGAFCVGPA